MSVIIDTVENAMLWLLPKVASTLSWIGFGGVLGAAADGDSFVEACSIALSLVMLDHASKQLNRSISGASTILLWTVCVLGPLVELAVTATQWLPSAIHARTFVIWGMTLGAAWIIEKLNQPTEAGFSTSSFQRLNLVSPIPPNMASIEANMIGTTERLAVAIPKSARRFNVTPTAWKYRTPGVAHFPLAQCASTSGVCSSPSHTSRPRNCVTANVARPVHRTAQISASWNDVVISYVRLGPLWPPWPRSPVATDFGFRGCAASAKRHPPDLTSARSPRVADQSGSHFQS